MFKKYKCGDRVKRVRKVKATDSPRTWTIYQIEPKQIRLFSANYRVIIEKKIFEQNWGFA